MTSVVYGSATIEYRHERRDRITLEITIEPSAEVLAVAPTTAEKNEIEMLIRKLLSE